MVLRAAGGEMLTRDKLTKALKQANETAKSALALGCTTDRGLAAQDAQRALQEADEYLAAGDSKRHTVCFVLPAGNCTITTHTGKRGSGGCISKGQKFEGCRSNTAERPPTEFECRPRPGQHHIEVTAGNALHQGVEARARVTSLGARDAA